MKDKKLEFDLEQMEKVLDLKRWLEELEKLIGIKRGGDGED
ncbi:MAG TPA: hypothetical protein PKZ88_08435 [Methanothermobacter sp.]|nr:hypothetical protein [Methanothermobacter sp.]